MIKRCTSFSTSCLLGFLILMIPTASYAQTPDELFGTITLSVSGSRNVDNTLAQRTFIDSTLFHQYWKGGYGGAFSIATPFYFGVAEAGGALHRYDVLDGDVPRFDAVLLYVGWGLQLQPTPWLQWYNGVRVGNYRMTFDVETFSGVRNENEFTLALHSRLQADLHEGWSVHVTGSLMQTYTFIRMRLVYASAGISYTLRTPGWLQEFLR